MNTFKNFLSFVEISTKLASFLPFLLALSYAAYAFGSVNITGTLLFLLAMFLFDMAVTAINNHIDRREAKRPGHFPRGVSLAIIITMCLASAAIGFYLVWLYGFVILVFGGICFAAGIGYTFGPFPISKSPYGELVSGLVQGFCLPIMVVFINAPGGAYISYSFTHPMLDLRLDIMGLLRFVVVMFPLMGCIANVMMANNISDYEKDMTTRYTFPRHVGIKWALVAFESIYAAVYLSVIAACVLGIVPMYSLLVLLTGIIVRKNIQQFKKRQLKAETFLLSIQNFVIIVVSYALCIGIGAIVQALA